MPISSSPPQLNGFLIHSTYWTFGLPSTASLYMSGSAAIFSAQIARSRWPQLPWRLPSQRYAMAVKRHSWSFGTYRRTMLDGGAKVAMLDLRKAKGAFVSYLWRRARGGEAAFDLPWNNLRGG